MKTRSRTQKRKISRWAVTLALVSVLVVALWPSMWAIIPATAMPLTARQRLAQAWRYAGAVGDFDYTTDVRQTEHPTPSLANAGRASRTQRFSAKGSVNRTDEMMALTLWSPGSGRDGVALRIEEGKAYGRLSQNAEWKEIPNPTDIFAPGGDLLGFLVAAENVQHMATSPDGTEHYAFDIDSGRYAAYIRDQMEAELTRSGELPPGVSLDLVRQYVDMEAQGEIWIDGERGLPQRQAIHMAFPPEPGAAAWTEADITTDFSKWGKTSGGLALVDRALADPASFLQQPTAYISAFFSTTRIDTDALYQVAFSLGATLLVFSLLGLTLLHYRSPRFYGAVVGAMVIAMVLTPLLRANQIHAFSARQQAKEAEIQRQRETEETVRAIQNNEEYRMENGRIENERIKNGSMEHSDLRFTNHESRITDSSLPSGQIAALTLQSTCDYTDTAGDCDGDGLSNGAELYKLGTDPEAVDSDNDDISDLAEVEGFSYNGQTWYLDPLNPDTNGDGIMDGLECVERMDIDLITGELRDDVTPGVCANSDDDTTPDVFDFDNDGDGVPDGVDASPYAVEGSFTSSSPLGFNLTFNATEMPVFVDFELRPTDPDHLWYTQNVLDWPDDDTEGQITRVHDITYADLSAYSDMEDGADGDLYLSPLLEIEVTYDAANPSAGLPITTGMSSADITDYSDLSWLDSDALDEVGASYNSGGDDTLYLWLPLYHVEDDVGDTPVAWTARMVYRPESGLADLGNDQQVRVVWMLEGLVDSCDTSGMTDEDDYDTYCADEENWTTESSVLQTYYDDFDLTGLSVREDHGVEVALIAEPASTGNVAYDDYLWHMADSLQVAFLEAMTNTLTSDRFAVADIATYKDTWGMSELVVTSYSFDSELGLADIAATHSTDVLNAVFNAADVDDTATLLVAGEDTARVTAMGDGNSEMSDGVLTVDLTNANLDVTAQLRWAPYVYEGAGVWDSLELETYMAELDTALQSVLTTAQIDILAGGEAVEDYDMAQAGAIGLAQSFYLSLYVGLAQVVEEDGTAYSAEVLEDFSLGSDEPITTIVQILIEAIQTYYADLALVDTLITANAATSYATSSLSATFADSLSAILDAVGTLVSGESSTTLSLAMQELGNYYKTTDVDTTSFTTVGSIAALAGASYVSQSRAMSLDLFSTDLSIPFTIARMAQHLYYVKWGWDVYKSFNTYVALASSAGQQGRTAVSLTYGTKATKVVRTCRVWAIAVLIITIAVVWGLFAYGSYDNHLERAAALAQAIAATIVAVIMALLAAIPVVGWIIVGVIGLIDALIMFICAVANVEEGSAVDRWVCGGISGAMTQTIVYMIFDQYIVADLQDDDRLEIALNDPTLAQKVENSGFVTGNQLDMYVVVTNTLSKASLTGIGSAMDDFFGTHDHDELLMKSTFSYTLQSSETDQHAGLSLGQLAWVDNTEVFTVEAPATFGSAGINQATEFYLTESFYVPALECWGFIVQGCSRADYRDSFHTYLGDSFVFDVFPNTFDGFYALTGVGDNSYRFAWDDSFPTLADADGDDLLSQAAGGPDPDDGIWDTDGDGLSDYWELDNGFDPESYDADGDGLYDYWEAFYNTDPYLADTDSDGLTDGDEMFHSNSWHAYEDDNTTWSGGWTIVYDYDDSGYPQQTRVSADPIDYDSDDDTILDNREFIYGYNPNLASVLNVLSLDTEVARNVVAPGDTLAYTATVKNELDNRVANGQLQAEFPVDAVQSTTIIGSLYPQMSATLNDAVTAPSVSATEATSLTLRAGAVIDTSAVNQIFVLNLDEDTGATTFYDATSNHHDFTKYGNPVANAGYVTFDGNDGLQYDADGSFDHDAFSFETWVMPTAPQSGTTLFRHTLGQFEVRLTTGYLLQVWINGALYLTGSEALTQDEWNHVMVTYDAPSGALAAYVNGQLDATISSAPAVSWIDPYDFLLGFRLIGGMDYVALHDYALSETEVSELFSNSLTFYATFDQGGCGSFHDAISYKPLDCGYNAGRSNAENPYLEDGILGTSLGFVDINPWDVYNVFGDHGFVKVDTETYGEVPLAGDDGAFTISMWLRKLADGGSIPRFYLFDLYVYRGQEFTAYLDESSDLWLGLTACDSSFKVNESEFLPDWDWHHLTLAYDGNGTLRIYADGEEVRTKACSGYPSLPSLYQVHFGAPDTTNTDFRAFRGRMDEIRFYSKALTDEEVSVLYKESGRSLHLAFDEPPGQTSFADKSPNSYDGACVGVDCPDTGLAGRNNQAIDMLENKITLETADQLGLTENNFTVMAWVKAEAYGGATRTVLGTETAQDLQGLILGVKAAKPYMSFWGTDNDLTGSTTLNAGEWVHLAWRYEYEEVGVPVEEMTLFINGVEEATASNRSAFEGTDTVYVGKSYGDSYFHGMIDDLVVVKQALSAPEIQEMMAEAPLFNLHLDEDLDTTSFTDDSPGQYTATCTGTACPEAGAKGQMREAPVFDGDDILSLPTVSGLDAQPLSLSMWVKPSQVKGEAQYLVNNNDNVAITLGAGGTGLDLFCNGVTYADNGELIEDQWNHVLVTAEYDADMLFATYTFYVNGSETGSVSPSGTCASLSGAELGENFEGSLDEVAIYDTLLNSEEVRAIYDYQAAWFDVVEQHLITIDADDPILTLNLPDYLTDAAVWLAIGATDVGSEIDVVQVTVTEPGGAVTTGDAVRSESGSGNNGAWLYEFVPAGEGAYTLAVVATDAVGNTTTVTHSLTVDGERPEAALDAALTATVLGTTTPVTGSETVALTGTVSDDASGVATNTVALSLYDWQGASVEGARYATANGTTWAVDYPFSTAPYGLYDVWLSLEDNAGNVTTGTLGTVGVDGYGPGADVALTGAVISTTGTVVTGVASDVPYPQESRVAHLHFEEGAGATEFADSSGHFLHATCSGDACPTAGESGKRGSAARFDGSDDTLWIETDLDPAAQAFTALAWFKTDALGDQQVIVQQDNGAGQGRTWLYLNGAGQLVSNLGETPLTTPSAATAGTWHHAALTYDGSEMRLYLDGALEISAARTAEAADGPLDIGSNRGWNAFFDGLIDEVVVYSRVLGEEEIHDIAAPLDGTVYSLKNDRVTHLQFEEEAGTSEFTDNSGNLLSATCTSPACPTAGEVGYDGSGVLFDGVDDTLTVSSLLDPSVEPFTMMVWFQVGADPTEQKVLLSQTVDDSVCGHWLYVRPNLQIASAPGGQALESGSTVSTGAWHHAAITYDGTEASIYIDGDLKNSGARTVESCDGPLHIGSYGGSRNFEGLLDEVVVYDRALSAAEIQMAIDPPALSTGVASAQIRYRHLQDGAQDASTGTWYDVTLDAAGDIFTTWQHTVPDDLDEGPYKIDLKATDDLGNASYIPNVWSGEIDLHAPELTYTYTPITGNYVRVSCEASDFSITTDGWVCPANSLYEVAESDTWFTNFFGTVTRTTTLTTPVQTLAAPGNTLTACDSYSHCTTETLVATPTITEVSAILTPTTGAGFYGYDPIEIAGFVRSPDEVRALTLTVDGQAVYTATWAAGSTEETWSTTWTPSTYGDYSLEAVLTNGLGETISDKAETIITVLYPDLTIVKSVTPNEDLQAGDAITYTLTITNSGNADAVGAVISDTLPTGVVGSDLYQLEDVAAGATIVYTLPVTVTGSELRVTNTGVISHTSGSAQDSVTLDRCDYLLVTSADDSGAGTLRQAMADACEGAVITFDDDFDIYLDTTLEVTKTLTIDGAGRTITVSGDSGNDGSRDVRVFSIASGSAVTLTHLSVVRGRSVSSGAGVGGGGIYNAGALTLVDVIISDNEAYHISWARGGGIFNNGTLTIEDSVLTDNVLSGTGFKRGGAIYNNTGHTLIINSSVISGHQGTQGGGIYNYGTFTSTQTTFVSNTVSGNGGGLYNYYATATLNNTTFYDNSANNNGGGIYNDLYSTLSINNNTFSGNTAGNEGGGLANRMLASVHISNTIIANSNATVDCFASVDSTAVSVVNSLFETYDGCGTPVATGDPLLSDLDDYGGDTPTFALLPGSPAIDAGDDATCESADQRGATRFGTCDIGAFESQGFGLSIAGGNGQSAVIGTAFDEPLALTVTANAAVEPTAGGVAMWSGPTGGAGITETVTATIGSSGAASATVTANDVAGSYTVTSTIGGVSSVAYTLTNLCSSDTYTVTSADDDGAGTLRRGILNTCGGHITFDGDTTILLESPLEIDKDLEIDAGGYTVTVSGQNTVPVMQIDAGSTVTLSRLSLVNGLGAIHNAGALTLSEAALSGHTEPAVTNLGNMTIYTSTFSDNSSHISNTLTLTLTNSALSSSTGDGVSSTGTLILRNVTLSGSGGDGLNTTGSATLNNVTLADSAGNGLSNSGTLTLRNTIIAGSTLSDCVDTGVIAANTHSLIEDDTCSPALSGDPLLSELSNYGGDTPVLALLPGSPALDAGDDATCESADQRGAARPYGSACDIGAFESQGFSLNYVSGAGQRVSTNTAFPAPLRVQVMANVMTRSMGAGEVMTYTGAVGAGGVVSYTGPTSGAGLTVSEAGVSTTSAGMASLDVTANDTYGTYVISATTIGAGEVITFSLENYACDFPLVTNNNNSGLGSLRQALLDACDGATITFDDDFTITLQSGLSTARQVTIDGSGRNIIISGNHIDVGNISDGVRPLTIERNGVVTLTHMSIISGTDNNANGGGGILVQSGGELHLEYVALQGNYAYASDGGGGIRVQSNGILTAKNSVFLNNTTNHYGGALNNQGGTTELVNCTISGNQSRYLGGAIYQSGGVLYVTNTSIVGNTAEYWGGPGLFSSSAPSYIRNTLFADNISISNSGPEHQCSVGNLRDSGNNLANGDTANCAADEVSDLALGTLGDYDAMDWPYLPTYPLYMTSPAIDAGDDAVCESSDQRGATRVGGPSGDGLCDIGAFEAQFVLTPTGGDGQTTPAGAAFAESLTVTVSSTYGAPVGADGVITFTGGGLTDSFTATVNAGGTASTTVTANTLLGSYAVTATGGGVITPATFTLTNTNTAPVVTPATFTVAEDAEIGTAVGAVVATDANGHTLHYAIIAGNTGGAFEIGSGGQITVASPLDYETLSQYTLTVAATDGDLTGTAPITVTVTDAYADLAVAKRAVTTDLTGGDTLTYTVTFTNQGGEVATGVVLTDDVPVELEAVAYQTMLDAGVTLTRTPNVTYAWTISDLAPGQGGVVTLTGAIPLTLGVGAFTNTATITGTAVEVVTDNNRDAAAVSVCGDTVVVTNDADSGAGSLRWAAAGVCPGGEITFADSFTITLESHIAIDQDVTISGGDHDVTLSGNHNTQILVIGGASDVTLKHLTIIEGYNTKFGGAVEVTSKSGAQLTIEHCWFDDNHTADGGGALFGDGPVTVISSTFSSNTADWGGAINNMDALTVIDSTFSGNSADTGAGGAIYGEYALTVIGSTFSGNSAVDWGGAIYSEYALTVTGSAFSGNSCPIGGALELDNGGWITATTFSDNQADYGGAVDVYGGELLVGNSSFTNNRATMYGGAIYNMEDLILTGSTFTGNRVDDGEGGAIYNEMMTVMITNTTFYDNIAAGQVYTDGGTYYTGFGGAISSLDTVIIANATFVSNTAAYTGTTLYNDGGTLILRNSIIAGQTTTRHCEGGLSENINNLIEDGSCSPALTGDPRVGALDDYGGETQTIPLLPGSPAIDAGNAADCASSDQRGITREGGPSGDGLCDIGAFESQGFTLTGSGGDQSALLDTAFDQPLTVTVTANASAEPVAGGVISFTAPSSGAGLTTSGFDLTLPSSGGVTATVTANGVAGSYAVTATTQGNTGSAVTFTLTNTTPTPDLHLSKTVTPTTAQPGGTITYTLVFTNVGAAEAAGVVITDTLPVSLSVQSVMSNGVVMTRTLSDQTFEVFETSKVEPGEGGAITITAVLSSPLPVGATLTNGAVITTATDSDATHNTATATLTVANSAPVLVPIADQAISETVALTFTATATDPNSDALTFGLGDAPSGAAISGAGVVSWTPSEADGPGVFSVTVVVSDSYGLTDSQVISMTVAEVASAPALTFTPEVTVTEEAAFTMTLTAGDADVPAQTMTFGLLGAPDGVVFDGATGLLTWTPAEAQGGSAYTMTATVTDTTGLTDTQRLTIKVSKTNSAPTLAPITASQSITELTTLTFTATATDTDQPTQALTFTLGGNVPDGAAIVGDTGVFTWTPTEVQGPGAYYVKVIVTDAEGGADSQWIRLTVLEDNNAPVLSPLDDQVIAETTTLTFTTTATDPDGQDMSFSFENAPGGARINGDSGLFQWTPTEAQGPGIYTATIMVDDNDLSDSQTITITVTEVNTAPVLDAMGDQTVDEGATVSFTATATDGDEPANTLSYSLSGEPSGATIDPTTGAFAWTTDESDGPGKYPLTVVVSDGVLTDSEVITITVAEVNTAPALGTIGDQTVDEGDTVTFTATANDNDEPANTLSYSLSGEPSGATIDPTTGAFAWTTDESDGPGKYPLTVIVSDGVLTDSAAITITVAEVNTAPVLAAIGDQTVDEGATVTFTATATDGDEPANTLSYSLSGAPDGATIDGGSGFFSWATDESDGPGVYPMTVIVSDGALTDSEAITITVNEVNAAPVAANDAYTTPYETTLVVDVANGVLANDQDVDDATLTATVTSPPSLGNLVLDPDGSFIYTPATTFSGTVSFAYRAEDAAGAGDTATVTLSVGPMPSYTLATHTAGTGSGEILLDPAGGSYGDETVVTLTAQPGAGSAFAGWSGDAGGVLTTTTVTMDADKVVTATFDLLDYTVTAVTAGDGTGSVSLEPAGGVYPYGTTITATALPDDGSAFAGWSGDITGEANPATLRVDGPKTVTATFSVIPVVPTYPLTVIISPTVGGAVTLTPPGGSYTAGTVVTLHATAAQAYTFTGWSGDLTGLHNPAVLTVTQAMTVTALFEETEKKIYLPLVVRRSP